MQPSLWKKFKAATKPALWTALFAFLGIFLIAVFGWLQALLGAFSQGTVVWPDVDPIGKAFLSGVGAAGIGLVNFLYRFLQEIGVPLPGNTPVYTPPGDQIPPPPR